MNSKTDTLDLREKLRSYISENNNVTQADIARAIGISDSALSQYLGGTYEGDNKRIDRAISAYLKRRAEQQAAPKQAIPFIYTSVVNKIHEVARMCHLYGEMGVTYGASGIGKTWAVREYTRQNPGTILIEVGEHCALKLPLLRELHEKLGLSGKGRSDQLFKSILNRLKDSSRLLIIDEAENLPYKSLEMLRRIHDFTGIGILLIGMATLVTNLQGRQGDYAQLYSRITFTRKCERLEMIDTESVVREIIPDANGLCKVFHEESYQNMRILTKLLIRTSYAAQINQMDITPDLIRQARESLILREA